jgi:alpha-mannosidase
MLFPFSTSVHINSLAGSIKKGNRKSEILMRDVEVLLRSSPHFWILMHRGWQLLATLATLFKPSESDYVYPQRRINDSWEKVLLNQCMLDSTLLLMRY